MGVFHHVPLSRPIKLVLLFLGGMLAVIVGPTTPLARGNCGGYVMPGHRSNFAIADFAGHPFGRWLERDQQPAQLAARAVLLLEGEREAQQAREAGYKWTPSQPVLPCQGPACSGRTQPSSPAPVSTPDYSGSEHWINVANAFHVREVRHEGSLSLADLTTCVGDWPLLVRPPNDSL